MEYRVTSTHTFASTTLEDERFASPVYAWLALAADYAASDHGQDEQSQDADTLRLMGATGEGSVTLSTGETVSVVAVDPVPTLGPIRRVNGVAGQYALDVMVTYPGEDAYRATFVGSVYGGRVVAIGPSGMETFVSADVMTRCGDMLTPEWVRTFFRADNGA